MTQFRKITSAEITHYSDNDDTMVYIGWTDAKGKLGYLPTMQAAKPSP